MHDANPTHEAVAHPVFESAGVDRRWGKVQMHHRDARGLAECIRTSADCMQSMLEAAHLRDDERMRDLVGQICHILEAMADQLGWLSIEAELTWLATHDRALGRF